MTLVGLLVKACAEYIVFYPSAYCTPHYSDNVVSCVRRLQQVVMYCYLKLSCR
jgi:hypothetical protein